MTFLPIVIKVYLLFSLPFEVKTMKSKIDYKEILKLIDLLEERNLLAFELEIEGLKIMQGGLLIWRRIAEPVVIS